MAGNNRTWIDVVNERAQQYQQEQNQKTPYQQNVSQPVQQSAPNARQVLGQIYLATQNDQQYGMQLQNDFISRQNDAGSIYFAPYSNPTNQAVSRLNEYGVHDVNQDWYNSTQFMDRYLTYNGQTNTPSIPKKNDLMGNIAYQRYQYGKGLEQTDKAKQECAALQEEIKFLTQWSDRNYSDDQIVDYLYGSDGSDFAKKYPTLAAMDKSMLPGNNLLELNEAIPYSKDWVYGNIWAARNNGGTGNAYKDMAMSGLGYGNQWQENPDITGRLDQNNRDTYAPYTVGSTTDDVCMYLGVTSYDKEYLNTHMPDPQDKTSVDMWNKGWDAASFTEDANAELENFNKRLDKKLQNATNPEDVMKAVDSWLGNEYSNLNKLDKSTEKINSLVDTSSAIDFSRNDIIRKVNAKCAENAARLNGGDTLSKNGFGETTGQSAEADKAGDQKVKDAADLITDGTKAEQNVMNNTPSTWYDRAFQSLVEAKNPVAMMKVNESEVVTKSSNQMITLMDDLMVNMKSQQQLDALNKTNTGIVDRCDQIRDGFGAGTGMFSFMYDIEDGPTVKRGDADVANSRYAPALVELYETVTGESAIDEDGGIKNGVMEKAQMFYDYIVNGNRTYEDDEELPWLLPEYEETKKNLETEIQRTTGVEQKCKWADLMWNARIALYDQVGLDSSELKAGRAISSSLYFFSDYDATDWQPYSYYDSMQKKLGDGASVADVLSETADYTQQAKDNMDTVKWELEYIKENNIQVPQEYLNNMQRYVDQNQRTLDDYVFYSLRGRDDFDEMVAKGKEIAKKNGIDFYDRFIQQNPTLSVMSEAEKDTMYYLLANPDAIYSPEYEGYLGGTLADFKDLSAGKDKGYFEASFYVTNHLADDSYGVLHKRYSDINEQKAREEVDAGFLSGLWANVKAIASAPFEAIAGGAYWLNSLLFEKEYNPYNTALSLGRWSETVNEQTTNDIKKEFGEDSFLTTLATGGYEILYNRGRSFTNMATFSFLGNATDNPILKELYGAGPMAAGAMSMETAHAKERGAQDWQAFAIGGISFIAEDFTEGLTYGNIQEAIQGVGEGEVARSVKDMLVNWLTKSGVEEMLGETASDIISKLGDDTIMGALSEHNELVNSYLEKYGLNPNNPIDVQKANEMARKDEMAAIVHTAIISYLSPGLDVVAGSVTDIARDFNNVRIATKNLQQNGMNVSMNDVRKEYQAKKAGAKETQNAPVQQAEQEQQEQATQTETQEENPNFSVEDVDADALFNQTNNEVSEQETSVAVPETKQMSTADAAFLNDLARLDAVVNSDSSTQAAAIGALFGGQTEAEQDAAKAAAVNITDLFGTMQDAVDTIKNMITFAHVGFVDYNAVKTAIQTAALSASSEARNMIQSEEFQNASPVEQTEMLASTVEADQANAAVQDEVAKSTYENRVAEAERELIRDGALDAVKGLKAQLDKAQENVRMAQESLEEKRAEAQAKSEALDAATKENIDNPTPDNTNAVVRAANELEKADVVQQEYEQHLDNIQRANSDAQTRYDDGYNTAMRDIRQQAEAVVADQNRQRAEREAQIAQQQQAAAEQAAQQQAEEDKRSGKKAEVDTQALAENWADAQHLEGEARENFIDRVKDRQEKLSLGQIDMNGKVSNAEGYLAIQAFARKTGLQFQLSDTLPAGTRGMYQNGVVYLNSNLVKDGSMTVGQALVEAALHEIPHSMEQTKNYQTYKKAALGYLYGSGADFNQAAYNAAIDTKINDYKKIGQNLTREQAEAEIVADFARLHLADKDVIQRFMDAGLGGKLRNTLHNINQAMKNFFGRMTGEERKMAEYLRKAERGYQKAMNELAKTEIHPEGGQFSVQQFAQSAGLFYNDKIVNDKNGNTIATPGLYTSDPSEPNSTATRVDTVTPEMIKTTPIGMLINLAQNGMANKKGEVINNPTISKETADKQYQMFADLMTMAANYQNSDLVWEIAGSTLYSALKNNSDIQYGTTVDFGTICAKTQEIVNVLSRVMQEKVARGENGGLDRDEVLKVYNETAQAGLTVPCPVCYVFSRWMGVPSLLGQMSQFQKDYVVTEKDENGNTITDDNGKAVIDWEATQKVANDYIHKMLDQYGGTFESVKQAKTDLEKERDKQEEKWSKAKKILIDENATEEQKAAAQVEHDDAVAEMVSYDLKLKDLEAFNWVTQALCKQMRDGTKDVNVVEDGVYLVDRDNFELTPDSIIFDLRSTGEFAKYTKNWGYRNSRGAAMGKAILPYSGEMIGDIIHGTTRWSADQNPFLKQEGQKAANAIKDAIKRAKKQNLIGGQRLQSTSDFRPEWGLDYLMTYLELQAIGSKTQMYTKVAEAIDFLASMGGDINLSIMGAGKGWHVDENGNAVLDFSDVTGMKYSDALYYKNKYDNVQMILVGMNDQHVKLAIASDDIDFVIPWHSSGNSKDALASMISSVDEKLETSDDYQNCQSDKRSKTQTPEQARLWDIRVKILTGEELTQDELETTYGDVYLNRLYTRFNKEGDQVSEAIKNDEFLRKHYERLGSLKDDDCFGVYLNGPQAKQIFPYEYWDTTLTKDQADENGWNFIQYCQHFGMVPRFSGANQTGEDGKTKRKIGNFAGAVYDAEGAKGKTILRYDKDQMAPGYWKLLIDRPMYDNNGNYRDQNVVDVTKAKIGSLSEADENGNRRLVDSDMPIGTSAKYTSEKSLDQELMSKEDEAVYNSLSALKKPYDVTGQASFYGDMTDADIDQALMENDIPDNRTVIYIKNGQNKTTGEIVDFIDLILNGEKTGETRTHNRLPINQWLGISKGGKNSVVYGRVKFGKPYMITKDSPEYKTSFIEGVESSDGKHTDYDVPEDGFKWYYPIEAIEDFRDNPQPVLINGSYGKYSTDGDITDADIDQRLADAGVIPKESLDGNVDFPVRIPFYEKMASRDAANTTGNEIRNSIVNERMESIRYNITEASSPKRTIATFDSTPGEHVQNILLELGMQPVDRKKGTGESENRIWATRDGTTMPIENIENAIGSADTEFRNEMIGKSPKPTIQIGRRLANTLNELGWTITEESDYIGDGGYNYTYEIHDSNGNKIGTKYGNGIMFDSAGYGKNLFDSGMLKGGTYRGSVWTPSENTNVRNSAVPPTGNNTAPVNPMMQNPNTRISSFATGMAQLPGIYPNQVKQYILEHGEVDRDTNAAQLDRAVGWIAEHATESDPSGFHGAMREAESPDFVSMSADGQARMVALTALAGTMPDKNVGAEMQKRLGMQFLSQGHNAGQTLQARKLFKLMTREGRMATLLGLQEKANQIFADKGKDITINLSDWVLQAAAAAETEEEFDKVLKAAKNEISSQTPVTWGERIIGFRMLAMLSAPRTHIKNVGGNLVMIPTVAIKNEIAAAIELGAQAAGKLDKSERTKTLRLLSDPEARQFSKKLAKDMESVLRGEKKANESLQHGQERQIFGTKDDIVSRSLGKFLNVWSKGVSGALEWEDWLFLKGHFTRALGGLMTARGLKPSDMKGKVLDKAIEYAVNEAQKATYRDESAVADKLNRIKIKGNTQDNKKSLAFLQWFVNANFPFKRTPINVGKRGVEYSLIGLGKSVTSDAAHLRQYIKATNGKLKSMPKTAISPTQFIDKLSSGLTGTGIMLAGIMSGLAGIARAGFKKKDPEDEIAKLAGEQEYSIRPGKLGIVKWINNVVTDVGKNFDPDFEFELCGEDVSRTLDWATPSALPYFCGVALSESIMDGDFTFGEVFDVVMETLDPMLNLTFLDGIKDIFNTSNYSDKDSFWQVLEKTALNYALSMIPTLSGQVSNAIDGNTMSTYSGSVITGDKDVDRAIQQGANKLRWINADWADAAGSINYTNILGEEPKRVDPAWFEYLLSPSYSSYVDESDEMTVLKRLYKVTKNKQVIPSDPGKSVSIKGKDIPLSGTEYTQMKEDYGEAWRSATQSLVNNSLYAGANDASKAAMYNLADTYAKQIASYKYNKDYKIDKWILDAYERGNIGDAIANKVADSNKNNYIKSKSNDFAKALYSGDKDDIFDFANDLEKNDADPSTVRKTLTEYFKPLYIEAYKNNDDEAMYQIEDILTGINGYVTLDGGITQYTYKKDFGKWIGSDDEDYEEEEESEIDWLNVDNNSGI